MMIMTRIMMMMIFKMTTMMMMLRMMMHVSTVENRPGVDFE